LLAETERVTDYILCTVTNDETRAVLPIK